MSDSPGFFVGVYFSRGRRRFACVNMTGICLNLPITGKIRAGSVYPLGGGSGWVENRSDDGMHG